MLARQGHSRRAQDRGCGLGDLSLQRKNLQPGIAQGEPVAFVSKPLLAPQQAVDDSHGLILPVALCHRVDAEGVSVGRQGSRS